MHLCRIFAPGIDVQADTKAKVLNQDCLEGGGISVLLL